ncbi:hypothetical protein HMF8227_02298 [Saliniradius amylolyticus]|uniref:DUF2884 family protein n=1 Tax=Saliniradius amylolyticus TaxID=2183582 RepID=A0A2S2E515_9ALTE|nr:DUF2884 family protein [Saliniradius amylolyticus]AWL12751.1 hypothetical protein HMF8227_02298 [Saliniradius amylolyticus]
MRYYFAIILVSVSGWVQAALKCDADLQYGVVVNENHVRVQKHSRTLYQINQHQQLIVQGHWIELPAPQQQQLTEFAEGLHYSIPKVIVLATEGVELAISTVEQVYSGLIGQRSDGYDRLQDALWRVRRKVQGKFIHANLNNYIGPRSLENVDAIVEQGFESEIEQAFSTSLGGILSAVGGIASEGNDNLDERVAALAKRLERMGQKIAPQADTLRKQAEWFCNEVKRLDGIEEQLRRQVPELRPYDLIITEN